MSSNLRRSAWNSPKSQFLVSAATAVLLAACSADMDRFSSNASGADPVNTASVPKNITAANAGLEDQVTSKPLANAATPPPAYDYSKPYQPGQQAAATAPAAPAAPVAPALQGGTVTVGPGMTLYSIARAHNVSVSELAAVNGLAPPYSVGNGQTLRLPGGAAAAPAAPATQSFAEPESTPIAPKPGEPAQEYVTMVPPKAPAATAAAPRAAGGAHTVTPGETLFSLGRAYGVSPFAIADANGLPHNAQLTIGQKVTIPTGGAAGNPVAATPAPAPKLAAAEPPAAPAAPAAEAEQASAGAAPATAGEEAVAEAPVAEPAAPAPAVQGEVAEQAPIDGAPGMRWPVRGKIISGFGPKANGLKNEGINIAVPEGTSIRAAADGVVAYAGNELKGYGNLVLIRHDNGYVTAYAHAKELLVKRGDTVKRGDVIAKAGQTGSVSSPQLHFEVRKGAVALDPMKFLSASTASN
ncbi:peptidoglycan DD-metalloendopeptidase family protein [Aestuariivirga sp.]|jgi:murein DD-endopeptidase MepM/ murein hydrolase activator NlpD|uniref:peptidoglycan DD-metalloendopeptidase family protein n=1 Tax=Aestuariivirga sp. TaxID=2650926 RepID=UPI003783DF60